MDPAHDVGSGARVDVRGAHDSTPRTSQMRKQSLKIDSNSHLMDEPKGAGRVLAFAVALLARFLY